MAKKKKQQTQQDVRDIISSTPLFADLSAPQQDELATAVQVMHHKNGHLFFQQGDKLSHIHFILEGQLKTFCSDDDGNEKIIQLLKQDDISFETAVFLDIPSSLSAQAVSDCTTLSIPSTLIRRFIHKNTAFANKMIQYISHNFQTLVKQIEVISLKAPYERVAYYLLHEFVKQGSAHKDFELPYKKSLLANKLGMTPETFSRALHELRRYGITIHKRQVHMTSLTSLCDFCDPDQAANCPKYTPSECPTIGDDNL